MRKQRPTPHVALSTRFWCDQDLPVSFGAKGLFAALVSYCGDMGTDGRISPRDWRMVTLPPDDCVTPDAVLEHVAECESFLEELLETGSLRCHQAGWIIPRFGRWNPTASEIEAKRKSSRKSSAKHRQTASESGQGADA